MDDTRPFRPLSMANTYPTPRPTLQDVLSNSAPPPWTLSAFTAYLSQNHCLENLEFTTDANRYRERYAKTIPPKGSSRTADPSEVKYVKMLWQRLLDAYIMSDGSREINIPSDVRERILSIKYSNTPPRPEVLTEAIQIIYNLMEESVLVNFLNDVPSSRPSPVPVYHLANIDAGVPARTQSRRVSRRDDSHSRASPASSIDAIHMHSSSTRSRPTRGHHVRGSYGSTIDGSLTDDSMSGSSPGGEPMTPPTTPPGSDIGGSSPKHRAGTDTAWKKMLMWKKKDGRKEDY